MLVLGIAVVAALLVPLLTGGSYARLVLQRWRWSALLFLGVALQIALEVLPIPESRWDDLGYALLLISYALIIAFCARNVLLRGMSIVLIGIACNVLVIALNHGMPVDLPPDLAEKGQFEATIKHHPKDADDRLTFLGDIIALRSPFDAAISFGDLILAVGLCDVTYHASRRKKARSTVSSSAPAPSAPEPMPEPTIALSSFPSVTARTDATDEPTFVAAPRARSGAVSTPS
jgi:Family of unknown function (DUF5317)